MTWWVIIASGPSLTRADCDALRGVGTTIAVNRAVFFTPWSHFMYASDEAFWQVYGPKTEWFKGKRITYKDYMDARQFSGACRFRRHDGGNGGHQAWQYAAWKGAKKIALIGFDHQHTDGRKHCHEDYPRQVKVGREVVNFGNAECTDFWVKVMNSSAEDAKAMGIEIVNLSRETALECFPRMTVEEFTERYI